MSHIKFYETTINSGCTPTPAGDHQQRSGDQDPHEIDCDFQTTPLTWLKPA